MSVSIPEFWKLLLESQLLPPAEVQRQENEYAGLKGAASSGSCSGVAEWLVGKNVVSRYQGSILRAGRSGPFHYGNYRVYDRIESGRLAGRFRATHIQSGYPVLLDFLTGNVAQDNNAWLLAVRQAKQLRQTVHANIARLFDLVDLSAFKFAAIDDLRGATLEESLSSSGRLSTSEACRIGRLAAQGLAALHSQQIVHGEIRPNNLWLQPQGNVLLLVAPVAHPLGTAPSMFHLGVADPTGALAAGADYLAPEIAAAQAQATTASDIYALGCLLYQLLAGQVPFAGGGAADKVQRHFNQLPHPLEMFGQPGPLAAIVNSMLAKAPASRPPQAAAIADALAGYVEPARLNVALETPHPQLAAYEQVLRERKPAAVEPMPSFTAAASTASPQAAGPAQPVKVPRPVGQVVAPTAATAGAAVATGTVVAAATAARPATVPARSAPFIPSKDKASQVDNEEAKRLMGWLLVAAMTISALVIFANTFSRSPSTATASSSNTPSNPATVKTPQTNSQNTVNSGKPAAIARIPNTGPSTASAGRPSDPAGRTNAAATSTPRTPSVKPVVQTIAPDDGDILWATPTQGAPLKLNYLPTGCQVFFALRPAEIAAHPEGEKLLAALGPAGGAQREWLENTTGLQLSEMTQVIIGLADDPSGAIQPSLLVTPSRPMSETELMGRWGNPPASDQGGMKYYAGAGRAYVVPPGSNGQFLVVPTAAMADVAISRGGPPLLSREMEELIEGCDASRHVTLVFAPFYLFGDGREILSGQLSTLREPLFNFFKQDELKAVALSAHLDQRLFVEMRFRGDLELPPRQMAEQLRDSLQDVPNRIESFVLSQNFSQHSKSVLYRYPAMINFLHRFTRTGAFGKEAVLRAYQPDLAAHNLLLGTELLLAESTGAGAASTPVAAAPTKPKTIAEKLQQRVDLSFPRNTLEVSIQLLSEEIGVPMEIMGPDLQLDGITKNQSFGIDLRDKPAEEILTQIMLLANPDKTATGPADPKQKLVYIVKPQAPGGEEMVFVTTRAQAEKRKDTLPPQFQGG